MSWKRICTADDVAASTLKKFDVDGIAVIVANYGAGYRVFPPICPHMEEPLDESGILADGVLTCTKHLWQWNLATMAMQAPAEKPLQAYESKEENGDIMVFLDKEIVYEFDEDDEFDDDDFFKD